MRKLFMTVSVAFAVVSYTIDQATLMCDCGCVADECYCCSQLEV